MTTPKASKPDKPEKPPKPAPDKTLKQVQACQRRLLHLHHRLASLGYSLVYTVTVSGGVEPLPPPPPAPAVGEGPDPDEPPC